jgi:pyridoxal biosynthesis lyase PdxS
VAVDHVEDDAHPEAVRRIDERAKVVRCAVEAARGKFVDTVVPPAELAGEVGHRHDLEQRDAELGEQRQFFYRRPERPRGREGTDM